jgi:hypothetical protein
MDEVDIIIRQYYENSTGNSLESMLMSAHIDKRTIVDHFSDIVNRVPDAMRFALTPTVGYESIYQNQNNERKQHE